MKSQRIPEHKLNVTKTVGQVIESMTETSNENQNGLSRAVNQDTPKK